MTLHAHFLICSLFLLCTIEIAQGTCPPDCHHGHCEGELKCYCDHGFLGSDCDVPATELSPGHLQHSTPVNNTIYFYYPIHDSHGDLTILIQKPNHVSAEVSISFEDTDDFELPADSVFIFKLSDEQTEDSELVSKKVLENNYGRNMIFKVNSSQKVEDILLEVYYDDDQSPNPQILLMVVICGAFALLICCIIIFVFLYRRRSLRNINRGNHQAEGELSTKDIHKYIPKDDFASFKNQFNQTNCHICLEEFEKSSLCLELYCGHISHVKCLETWLQTHPICPDCRTTMTLKTIKEKFYEMRRQKEKGQEEKRLNCEEQILTAEVLIDIKDKEPIDNEGEKEGEIDPQEKGEEAKVQ